MKRRSAEVLLSRLNRSDADMMNSQPLSSAVISHSTLTDWNQTCTSTGRRKNESGWMEINGGIETRKDSQQVLERQGRVC